MLALVVAAAAAKTSNKSSEMQSLINDLIEWIYRASHILRTIAATEWENDYDWY